jgi:hypothetical protein
MNIVPIRDIVTFARGVRAIGFRLGVATRAKATHAGESLAGKVSIRLSSSSSDAPVSFPPFAAKAGRLSGLFVFDGAMAWTSSAVGLSGSSSDHGGIDLFVLP